LPGTPNPLGKKKKEGNYDIKCIFDLNPERKVKHHACDDTNNSFGISLHHVEQKSNSKESPDKNLSMVPNMSSFKMETNFSNQVCKTQNSNANIQNIAAASSKRRLVEYFDKLTITDLNPKVKESKIKKKEMTKFLKIRNQGF